MKKKKEKGKEGTKAHRCPKAGWRKLLIWATLGKPSGKSGTGTWWCFIINAYSNALCWFQQLCTRRQLEKVLLPLHEHIWGGGDTQKMQETPGQEGREQEKHWGKQTPCTDLALPRCPLPHQRDRESHAVGEECRKGRGKVPGIMSTREHVFFCTRISNLKFLIGTKWNHLKFPWHTTAPGLQQGETDSTQKFANKLVQSQWSGKGSKGEDRENSKLHCLCCKTVANLGYKRNMALLSPEKGWW